MTLCRQPWQLQIKHCIPIFRFWSYMQKTKRVYKSDASVLPYNRSVSWYLRMRCLQVLDEPHVDTLKRTQWKGRVFTGTHWSAGAFGVSMCSCFDAPNLSMLCVWIGSCSNKVVNINASKNDSALRPWTGLAPSPMLMLHKSVDTMEAD